MRPCRCATSMRPCAALQGTSDRPQHVGRGCGPAWRSGSAVRSKSSSARMGDTASTLSATGTAAAAQLKPFLPSAVKVSGATAWRLATRVPQRCGQRGAQVRRAHRIGPARPGHRAARAGRQERERSSGRSRSPWSPMATTLCSRAAGSATCARSCASRASGAGWSLDRGGIRADGNAPALAESSRPAHRGRCRALRAR